MESRMDACIDLAQILQGLSYRVCSIIETGASCNRENIKIK